MGHREDLLDGARRCLLRKGFARTTARDIVKESGTNLASIGYHYGSKDALLAQAFIGLIRDVGDAMAAGEPHVANNMREGSLERFRAGWEGIIRTFPEHRAVWQLNLEAAQMADRMPEVWELLTKMQSEGRAGLIRTFTGRPEDALDGPAVDSLGAFYQVLLSGLTVQLLFDPDAAPDAARLTEGLRRIMELARTPG
ncbi:TetR/AcrR family transcriptional regulator [Streptomyces alanosinicus]|uniref:TetR family transcriptional regulator n=1 Tax=Streptomyces alanosinicus TaxID=68171 RepID=A0A919D8V8_9ACTN|nr:TetR/AcrR family transcriptional regulator [Streptomyces alanosinicus]GHE16161.1 TetR family transcriptional regulator [Streptomyces alanosinicus]